MIFVDTSAFFSAADRDDKYHHQAVEAFRSLLEMKEQMITHNYVVVETTALLQRRLSKQSAVKFLEESSEFFTIEWVDSKLSAQAAQLFRQGKGRDVSFVDCASFAVMEHHSIEIFFGFDRHFQSAGYKPFIRANRP